MKSAAGSTASLPAASTHQRVTRCPSTALRSGRWSRGRHFKWTSKIFRFFGDVLKGAHRLVAATCADRRRVRSDSLASGPEDAGETSLGFRPQFDLDDTPVRVDKSTDDSHAVERRDVDPIRLVRVYARSRGPAHRV